MFHKHKFKKECNCLWCECGKVKYIKCDHDWVVHSSHLIINMLGNEQTQQILKCKKCGKLKSINLTTGDINI